MTNNISTAINNLSEQIKAMSDNDKTELKMTVKEIMNKYSFTLKQVTDITIEGLESNDNSVNIFNRYSIDYHSIIKTLYLEGMVRDYTLEEIMSKMIGRLSGPLFEAVSAETIAEALAS